ncbi:helix-turn-helix domain-containing protein [Streptomyces chrestomyceticus]
MRHVHVQQTRVDDLDVVCVVLDCEIGDLLIAAPG